MFEISHDKIAMRLCGVMAEGRSRFREIEIIESSSPTEEKERRVISP
jgi:hypothetical protein